jgi:[1-hydroxy-2-(trimethylamino)ethyl]phosphonate dioxygenase
MHIIDRIFELFAGPGQAAYFGEPVSQTEHALQTALQAEVAGADDCLTTAALLHDVGHLLHGLPEDVAVQGVDARHEEGGADWLRRYFAPAITAPIRVHVPAKRYLCAVEPSYLADLSPASQLSLRLQGGPMPPEDARRFERDQHFAAAVLLRRWDDAAKVPGLVVPGLEHYRARLEAALVSREGQRP